jgi:hypothetical protein
MGVGSAPLSGAATPGRSCPIAYRYSPEELATGAAFHCETLYVVGGLYGNTVALKWVLERVEGERHAPSAVVFNGDFHWLDVDADEFQQGTERVLAHHAIRGNVEAELATTAGDAGCGCAYPEYIDDATVARSNAIMARLRDPRRPAAYVARWTRPEQKEARHLPALR